MQEYENYVDKIYGWVREVSELEPNPAQTNLKKIDKDAKGRFCLIKLGEIQNINFLKSHLYETNEDGTLSTKNYHRYSQNIDIEFIGEGGDYEALKVKMSMLSSSNTPQDVGFASNPRILNLTTGHENDYEERYMLSLTTYFTLSETIVVDVIESIEFNGKVNT